MAFHSEAGRVAGGSAARSRPYPWRLICDLLPTQWEPTIASFGVCRGWIMLDRATASLRKLSSQPVRVLAGLCWAGTLGLLVFAAVGTQVGGDRLAAVTAGGTLALAGSALLAWSESRALVVVTRSLVSAAVAQVQAAYLQVAAANQQTEEAKAAVSAANAAVVETRRQTHFTGVPFLRLDRPMLAMGSTTGPYIAIPVTNLGPGPAVELRLVVELQDRGDSPWRQDLRATSPVPLLVELAASSLGDAIATRCRRLPPADS
jgi:hypothetical protein